MQKKNKKKKSLSMNRCQCQVFPSGAHFKSALPLYLQLPACGVFLFSGWHLLLAAAAALANILHTSTRIRIRNEGHKRERHKAKACYCYCRTRCLFRWNFKIRSRNFQAASIEIWWAWTSTKDERLKTKEAGTIFQNNLFVGQSLVPP